MLASVTGADYMRAALFLMIKLLFYLAASLVLVFLFPRFLVVCAIGYTVGLPVTVTAYFAYKIFHGKNS